MKTKIISLTAFVMALVFMTVPVYAQTGSTANPARTPTATPATTPSTTTNTANQNTNLLKKTNYSATDAKTRIASLKAKLKTVPTTAQLANLKTKCVSVQAILKARTAKHDKNFSNLENIYNSTIAALASYTGSDKTVVSQKVEATYKASVAAHTTVVISLNDVASMDCATDPTAFRAALDQAATDLKSYNIAAKEFLTYINGDVITSLEAKKGAN